MSLTLLHRTSRKSRPGAQSISCNKLLTFDFTASCKSRSIFLFIFFISLGASSVESLLLNIAEQIATNDQEEKVGTHGAAL